MPAYVACSYCIGQAHMLGGTSNVYELGLVLKNNAITITFTINEEKVIRLFKFGKSANNQFGERKFGEFIQK